MPYCQECGSELSVDAELCEACDHTVTRRTDALETSKRLAEKAKVVSGESFRAFRRFAINPVGGLEPAYSSLEKSGARNVGVLFGVVFSLCLVIGTLGRAMGWLGNLGLSYSPGFTDYLKVVMGGLVLFASLFGSAFLVRKIFRGEGCFEGDVFFSGAALLPFGALLLLTGILGALNLEVITILAVFAWCYTVLMLFTGCRRISMISDAGAAAAVPVMLLVSAWLTKIVLTAIL